jgi:glycosyltransferase involved in cell wall biosynthesis
VAPRIRFAGHVEEVDEVYRALDAFVFPSRNEGLGSALLAAMAHALPVVAAAGGASPEIVRDGADGLLARPPDAEGIAAAVERILNDPALAARLGEAARATVAARFTAARMVEGTLAAYAAR